MMYKCGYCDKFFTSKKKRSDHERKVHPARERQDIPATERNVSESKRAREKKLTPVREQPITPATELQIKTPSRKASSTETQSYHYEDEVPNIFELPEEEEEDTYRCGGCGKNLDSALPQCPYCGVTLKWE